MAEPDKRPVTMQELLVSSLAQTDALAKLLIQKGSERRIRIQTLVDRQREYKPASLADFALYPDLPPMQFDELLGQG